jgi:hypothetical protein
MVNKSKAERSAIARKAVETRKRNLRLASSNGKTVPKGKVTTKVYTRNFDTDLRIAVALLVQKSGIEFPEHLKDVGERITSKLAPPAPKAPKIEKPAPVEPSSPIDINAALMAFASKFGLTEKAPSDKE